MSDVITVETAAQPDAAIIWMHGLGADGADFPPTLPYLLLPESLKIRFLFPNAPVRPVTVNGGFEMRSWYDIISMDNGREINGHQLDESIIRINKMVDDQIEQGIDAQRILLVGFSQGGAVAYETGLQGSSSIGGIAAMSTYLPRPLSSLAVTAATSLPVLILHGTYDDVVPLTMAEEAKQQLKQTGFDPEFYEYAMAHEVSVESLKTLGSWISQRLSK
ncbi:dienelactone hydrolase family protein [Neptunomonas phycophila]|uniref:alpha/beta hydrolase n=1 Tax=Neptunomonas TaxID=75687 RepID=UPI000948BC35|nr:MULTISPECIES: dienelactone hydrolase family protein [Neptunomonas]MDN2658426.1 dienelactone hydrolase family protein [Neptunomonas sp. CHC150]MDO6468768.1 dienelactone hydrolase family protein [Neptunomonas phycophila]MDO6785377.1 dienelactone hydrolase family protein [Neptunomonas phycophila]